MTATASPRELPLFPLFVERYWRCSSLGGDEEAAGPCPAQTAAGAAAEPPATTRSAAEPPPSPSKGRSLQVLDLRTLQREDGPPSELRARKEKLAFFEVQASEVGERLHVGAEAVARSREALLAAGITHVVNCVGFLYPPYFEDELTYKTLYLQDTPGEDILCILYDVFDFIEEALAASSDTRVLVHCSQGVSRSASLAIAYLMWKQGACYDDVFLEVKGRRGVANPNIGFICQLLQWHKRRQGPVDWCRLYRIAPQSASAAQYLVPKAVSSVPTQAALDPRGAFVLHAPGGVAYLWRGAACPEAFAAAAARFIGQLVRYEGASPPEPAEVRQGEEPAAFWACLAAEAAAAEGSGESEAAAPPAAAAESCSYDRDFELYARALTSRSSGDGGDSARSGGKKTPRDEAADDAASSPNDRLRKQARGVVAPPSPGKKCAGRKSDVSTSELERGISMDSAAAQLGQQERNLRDTASPPLLARAGSAYIPPPIPREGALTARGERAGFGGGGSSSSSGPRGAQPSRLGPGAGSGGGGVPPPTPRGGRAGVPSLNLKLTLPGGLP